MKTILIFSFIVLSYTSCTKDENAMFNLDTAVEISIINEEGIDMLNPENQNAITENNIKIFDLVDGEIKEVYNSLMDYPKGFMIYEHRNEYRIRIFTNYSELEEYPITYVAWDENDMDTIRCEIEREPSFVRIKKAWFNGELRWPPTDGTDFITIVK